MKDNNVGTLLACMARRQDRFQEQADQLAILEADLEAYRKVIEQSILAYMQVKKLSKLVIQDDSLSKGDVWVYQRASANPRGEDTLSRYLVKYVYAEDIGEIPF